MEEVVVAVEIVILETVTEAVEPKLTSLLVPEIGNVPSSTVATQTSPGGMNATNVKHPNPPELAAVIVKTVAVAVAALEAVVAAEVAMAIVTVEAAAEALAETEEAASEVTDAAVALVEAAEVETVALAEAVAAVVTAAVQCAEVAEAVIASVLIRFRNSLSFVCFFAKYYKYL